MKTHKTYAAKASDFSPKWYLMDAKDQVLGRLSVHIANILRGKTKTRFSPHVDCGDFVVVINANKIKLTGKKWTDKIYYHHTAHIGGLKSEMAKEILAKHPERLIMNAVQGMLPKNKLSDRLLTKLRVFAGETHTHQAQNPEVFKPKDL